MLGSRAVLAAAALVVTGCGGSGGAAPITVTPTPTPTPTVTPTPTPTPTGTPTATPTPSPTPACEIVTASPTSLSPYSDAAFRSAIDNVRSFQWPASVNACMSTAQLQAFMIDPDNFYHDSAGRMVFSFRNGVVDDNASATTRMELRGTSFDATSTGKMLDLSFQLPAFAERSASFTIGQVYGESDGLPILRIAAIAQRAGMTDRVWAVYRRGTGDGDATFYDLGPFPGAGETMRIRIGYNVGGAIEVFSSGTNATTRLTENLSFWTAAGKTAYLKTGCYLQAAGGCEVRFTALTLDR